MKNLCLHKIRKQNQAHLVTSEVILVQDMNYKEILKNDSGVRH